MLKLLKQLVWADRAPLQQHKTKGDSRGGQMEQTGQSTHARKHANKIKSEMLNKRQLMCARVFGVGGGGGSNTANCNTKHETKREGGGRDGQATRLVAMRFAANLNVCFWLDECEAETVSSDIKVGASAREPRRALHALQHVLQEHRAQARSKLLRSRHSIWHRQQWDLDQRCLLSASQAQENAKKGGKKGHWRRRAVSRDSSGRVLRG